MKLSPLGDSAVVALLGDGLDESTLARVRALAAAIAEAHAPGILEVVPAFGGVTVIYDPVRFTSTGARPYPTVCQLVAWCAERIEEGMDAGAPHDVAREVEIPVCYGGGGGPDIGHVAAHCGLGESEVIALHAGGRYLVGAIGFVPGFPYLGGLPSLLHVPRRTTPRARVPAGSVAIGGAQTGVYPLATPGGWHIIGRTPLILFRPMESVPCVLHMGDSVRFKPISEENFAAWK